jgi:hypothetical protein
MAFIPPDFTEKPTEAFDKKYMKDLFDTGYESITKGDPWMTRID